jgi:hypothetical protein
MWNSNLGNLDYDFGWLVGLNPAIEVSFVGLISAIQGYYI